MTPGDSEDWRRRRKYNMISMRSLSFPKLAVSRQKQESKMSGAESPYCQTPTHSRNSSGTSSASSPITPTSSNRSHSRWPSSTSSLATTPDSSVNVIRSPLHDVVEDPAERDDTAFGGFAENADEPLCICDTPFCEHRRNLCSLSAVCTLAGPEWTPGDDSFCVGDLPSQRPIKRRGSGELGSDSFSSCLSRHLPSVSKRWRDVQPSTSLSSPLVRSAPHSRASSMRRPSLKQSLATQLETATAATPVSTPVERQAEDRFITSTPALLTPGEIKMPEVEDPIDRAQLASTPLLPPMFTEHRNGSTESVQSPLQSPKVAEPRGTYSHANTPVSTPVLPGMPTPPLSSKPSTASFHRARSDHVVSSSEIPHMPITEETDPWAVKLGHANFHIFPEPYMPDVCDLQSCRQLLEGWESARRQYMAQAARTSEHYGPTSQTYKLTEQKWAEIDSQWRTLHEQANVEAEASGEATVFQPLAETASLSKMPSLNDPQQPGKFLNVDEANIVGPMVQYAKIQRRPSQKATFLKFFTNSASLLGRSSFEVCR